MTTVSQADLPELPIETAEFSKNPDPYADAARRVHPWLARFSQGLVVHGYQATKDLLADDQHFHPGFSPVVEFYGLRDHMWGRFMEEMLLSVSGEKHKRLRNSVVAAFTPRRANQVRPLMRKVISELLDEWAPKGAFDFAEFSAHFPVAVVLGLLGVSAEVIPKIHLGLENQLSSLTFNPAAKPLFLAGWDVLWEFSDQLVIAREASGAHDPDSLLDALIETKKNGLLDETELRFMLLVLVVAGYDTSKNMLALTMRQLIARPEIYARCAEDLAYCGKVLDEALRHSSITTPYRTVSCAFEYGGFHFEKGTVVIFATALAGRDPAAYDEPLMFEPERKPDNRHVAFGRGAHICLGQFIARAQLEEGVHLITQRLKNPRVTAEPGWRPFLGTWGYKTLPIAFDPAPSGTCATESADKLVVKATSEIV
jgi:cytochrome P450